MHELEKLFGIESNIIAIKWCVWCSDTMCGYTLQEGHQGHQRAAGTERSSIKTATAKEKSVDMVPSRTTHSKNCI